MQSLIKFTSQKSFMRELLKDTLPQNEKRKEEDREFKEKWLKVIDSKHETGEETGDGLSFLFVKEVKVTEPEKVKNLETQEEESSE